MRKPLTKLARPSGALAMVAVDQREALRGMFAPHQSTPVPDSQLTQFKVDVARELSPYASALLVDQEFGIDAIIDQKALQGGCGLIAAADLLVGPAVLWRNDESPDVRAKLVEDFNKLCEVSGLPSIIEIIVKPPTDSSRSFNREEELIIAAREAAAWKPDLYKAEVPFHGEGDLNLVTKNADRISEAIGSPWVVLSNGVKQPFFNDAVKACAMGGASGFLAGRAVWADIVSSPDIPKALREISIPRLEQLAEIVDTHAKPWTSW
jgi:sulfofructosephosphate aldolase